MNNHDREVDTFFKMCKKQQPQKYKDLCERYPILRGPQWRDIQQHEVALSELDNIPPSVAQAYGIETDEEGEY
jgi:hypothetical protein